MRFRPNVFRHTDLLRIEILKKRNFKNSDFRYHRKMYRLLLVYPFLGDFFLLKVEKECVYVIMLKIALILVKIYFLVRKKGISKLLSWVAAKHTARLVIFLSSVVSFSK